METTANKIDAWLIVNKEAFDLIRNNLGKRLFVGDIYFDENKAKEALTERETRGLVVYKVKLEIGDIIL
ncbi:hypothetical protein KKG51_02370 [Patescibacteria group bacterium]|nr:hypothetical protein [Patescibacteria group bacterium]